MTSKNKLFTMKILVNVCRLMLAATFMFSGFIKANDPFGTVYKLEDYLSAWSLNILPETFLLGCAVLLALFEFMLGINLLFCINRKSTVSLTVLFMGVMTLLTVYIAIANPVSDCGCFGDAIILSNEATLGKNIVLMAAAIVVLKWSKLMYDKIAESVKGFISLISFIGIVAYVVYCINCLPYIDFRPYKVGTNLREAMEKANNQQMFEVSIIYEKDGETLELSLDDDDPDSTWTYVETRRKQIGSERLATADFFVADADEEEVTDDILYADGYTLLLTIPDLKSADEECIDKVNEAYDISIEHEIGFYCLTSSADEESQTYWRDHTGAEYDFYISDNRLIKTIVRGNPGLVLMKDGVILKKWSNYNLPDEQELMAIVGATSENEEKVEE